MGEKLKPCPFCGGEAELRTSRIPHEWAARVQCLVCDTEKIRKDYFEERKAITCAVAAWNLRADEPRSGSATPDGQSSPGIDQIP